MAQTNTVPMGFEPGQSGSYTFNFNGVSSFDPTSYIFLEDKALGIMHDVRSGAYTFSADSADNWDRFVLHFTPPATTSITDATCNNNGTINVIQPGTASWNYTVTNSINTTISSGTLNQNNPLNISEPAGAYTLTLVDNNNYTVTQSLQVNGPEAVTAAFTSSSNNVQEMQDVVLSANGTAGTYNWDFGNGQTGTGQTITISYPAAGVYTVALTVTNVSGCTANTAQTITVNAATTTGINNIADKAIAIWSNESKVYVDFRGQDRVDAVIAIYDVLGRQISNEKFSNNLIYTKEINNIDAAYMIVSVKNNDKVITRKVFIGSVR
jgi:hypothetical protein